METDSFGKLPNSWNWIGNKTIFSTCNIPLKTQKTRKTVNSWILIIKSKLKRLKGGGGSVIGTDKGTFLCFLIPSFHKSSRSGLQLDRLSHMFEPHVWAKCVPFLKVQCLNKLIYQFLQYTFIQRLQTVTQKSLRTCLIT